MNHVTAYLVRESRAAARVGEQADRGNRRSVVAYMVGRGLVPKRWGKLPVWVDGEDAPWVDEGSAGECVGLIFASAGDKRFRWVVRYTIASRAERGRGARSWVERRRIEIPCWDMRRV